VRPTATGRGFILRAMQRAPVNNSENTSAALAACGRLLA
jgi:hypothetical protein